MSVPSETVFQVIGAGRIGLALVSMGPSLLRRRGEAVLPEPGPIVVCARNDDLDAVLGLVPAERRGDLCFVQNGLLGPWFAERGLAGEPERCERALRPTGSGIRGRSGR